MEKDIFDRYTSLFFPDEDGGESTFWSEEPFDLEAMRRVVPVDRLRKPEGQYTGRFADGMTLIFVVLDCLKSEVRWHEDHSKAQSIEGDYEEMARYFRDTIEAKLWHRDSQVTSLNMSELDLLIHALRGPDEDERRALSRWDEEHERMAQTLADELAQLRLDFEAAGCQSLYDFLC